MGWAGWGRVGGCGSVDVCVCVLSMPARSCLCVPACEGDLTMSHFMSFPGRGANHQGRNGPANHIRS